MDDVPQIDISTFRGNEENEILKRFIGTKSSSWVHEKEIRLIFENTGLLDIDFKAVTAIYFGCRMPDNDIDYIMEKLKGRRLKYYKMVNINNSYRFEAKEIDDKYYDASPYSVKGISYDIDNLLLSGTLTEDEKDAYKEYFIIALEMIKDDPVIDQFNFATTSYDHREPILKVFGNTKILSAPVKSFDFKIKDGKVERIK